MAKFQYRPSLLTPRKGKVMWLILHHTRCMYPQEAIAIDNQKYQMPTLSNAVMEDKSGDINYNFIVEQVKNDVQVFNAKPFVYSCHYPDIPTEIENHAIHIALMGSYDFKVPTKRLYETLAYRCLNPLVRVFHIPVNHIKLHSEVSTNKDEQTCPGVFVDKAVIISMVNRYVIKASY